MTTPYYYEDESVTLYLGDSLAVLRDLPDGSVDCCVTSPPYFGLRDYGVEGQYGLEASPAEYVETMRALFAEVRRVLADDGTLWLNLGDSYSTRKIVRNSSHQPGTHPDRTDHDTIGRSWAQNAREGNARMPRSAGLPEKNLIGIPWRTAFALQDAGWILRNSIIWHKTTAMPESVTDRLSNRHENLFLFSKSKRYWFDLDAIREPSVYGSGAPQLDWARESKEADVPGQSMRQHRTGRTQATPPGNTPQTNLGPTGRRHGKVYNRPQMARAQELAREHGLTEEHFAAIRAVGMSDSGKAKTTQTGTGKNRPDIQALADDAKAVLGGYYREFLTPTGKNPGDVWSLPAQPFAEAHFATMPVALAERCVQAGCKTGGVVLDPFSGSGTTGLAAAKHGRRYVGIDLNREYLDLSLRTRLAQTSMLDGGVA